MKNKKVWCEKRETKEKGFFEKIRNSCFKASLLNLDIARALLFFFIVIIMLQGVKAASVGHFASAISSAQFESGNYSFPDSLFVRGILNVSDVSGDKLWVSPDGNVGIGTTSPGTFLTINGTKSGGVQGGHIQIRESNASYTPGILFVNTGNVATYNDIAFIGANITSGNAKGSLIFATRNSDGNNNDVAERMRIQHDGNVGIGTVSPANKVEIKDITATTDTVETKLKINRQTTGTAANGMGVDIDFTLEDDNGDETGGVGRIGALWVDATVGSKHGALIFGTRDGTVNTWAEGMERMRIDHLGNVGIGTTTPSHRLDVRGVGNFSSDIYARNATLVCLADGSNCPAGAGGGESPFANNSAEITATASVAASNLNFTFDSGTLFVNPKLDRVGIGTTSPSAKLEVYGDDYLIEADTSHASNAKTMLQFMRQGVSKWYFNLDTSDSLDIGGKMVIQTGGNVGIGTTSPSALLTASKAVSAGSDNYLMNLINPTTATDARVGINFTVNAVGNAGATIKVANDGASGGDMTFSTITSG
ncbi:MAG: hypothetical protein ISS23_03530, partial [Nanoarchaeota archaeon]|nr:hypothetical protein [Nanoarchaeota archaeon]